MRRFALIVALLALVLVAGAEAQVLKTQTYTTVFTGTKAGSTSVSLANSGADTLAWSDMTNRRFPCSFEGQPQMKGIVSGSMAAGDSVGVLMQFSPDKTLIFSKQKIYFSGASPQIEVLQLCGGQQTDPGLGAKYVRWIVSDENLSHTEAYTSVKLQIIFIEAE